MPLEVRELNIKITVGDDPADTASEPAAGGNGSPDQVRQIVEKVLEVLDKRKDR
ncbi:hypothetical protein GGR26_002581 [Lewinella marina]|uniref:DUF5908 family protein n=1 Tax=Neolewinella marina TaxID=438751 RepID=UPI00142F7B50|nr:DUF5908 family protein [Neolewinella marina]NJB86804.1 hypothetical protein [Neolewinella marina]